MRFEPERVVSGAAVDSPDALTRFLDGMSVRGWKVEREPVKGTSMPLVPIMAVLVGWFLVELYRVAPSLPLPVRIGAACCYLASLAYSVILAIRRLAPSPPDVSTTSHILATEARAEPRPARVIIFTPSRKRGGKVWRDLGVLIAVLILPGLALLLSGTDGVVRVPPWTNWVIFLGQWFGVCLALASIGSPTPAVSASGLAMLSELARTWPRRASERVETWFVVTPRAADLRRELHRRFGDGIPTLAVALDSLGTGPELVIAGRGEVAELVANAASELWVPNRRIIGRSMFRSTTIPCVTLSGANDGRPIDPVALARVAQLVNEVALRWARRAEADQDLSRARSSQNPG